MPLDIVTLRQNHAKAHTELEAILATVAATDAEADQRQEKFDAKAKDVERLKADIANAERLQNLRGSKANSNPDPNPEAQPEVRGFMAKYANLPKSAHTLQPGEVLTSAQTAAFGDFLLAVRRAQVKNQVDPLLIEASQGANEALGEDGGFPVTKDIADGLLRRTFEVARIGNKVRRIPISASANGLKINALKDDSRATGSRWGGVQTYWIGEGDSLTPSRPKFRQMNLQLKKLAGLLYATDEMLQDSIALAGVISQAFPDEFSFMVDDAIFEGPGSSAPLGFMNAGCKVSVAKETGQAAKSIVFENVTKMLSRLRANSIAHAEWWVNQDCMPALQSMALVIGTGGVPVYLPPGGLSGSPYGTLLGRPVIPMEYCSTLGTEGDVVLCDPTQYVMIDKGDVQYATSIHVAFTTDEQAFRFIYRVDGQPVDDKPVTPFKGTNTQSPFVTLATRA